MTIHTRMQPRNGREKDLLKYGRRQGREQATERFVELLGDDSEIWDSPLGVQEALLQAIRGKTNFETYLEEQLKNPAIKEVFEQGLDFKGETE